MLIIYFLQSMENTLDVLEHLTKKANAKLSEKQDLLSQLNRETEDQKPKIERAIKQVMISVKCDLSYF